MYNKSKNTLCKKLYSFLFHVCYDPIGTHKKIRAVFGFIFGFLLALIFYLTIIIDLELNRYTTVVLGAIVVTMLSIGCASSIQVHRYLSSYI